MVLGVLLVMEEVEAGVVLVLLVVTHLLRQEVVVATQRLKVQPKAIL